MLEIYGLWKHHRFGNSRNGFDGIPHLLIQKIEERIRSYLSVKLP